MKYFAHILVFSFLLGTALVARADTGYIPLAPLDGVGTGAQGVDLTSYLQNLFKFAIAFATVLAIFMITLGGIQYMSTDAIGKKKDGIEKIKGALIGLALAILAWLILFTVNPKLVSLDVVNTLPQSGASNRNTSSSNGTTPPLPKNCAMTARFAKTYPNNNSPIVEPDFGSDKAGCDATAARFNSIKYTTGDGCQSKDGTHDRSTQYCFNVYAGGYANDSKLISTECTTETNNDQYNICERKKKDWESHNAFVASCKCE